MARLWFAVGLPHRCLSRAAGRTTGGGAKAKWRNYRRAVRDNICADSPVDPGLCGMWLRWWLADQAQAAPTR